ncbi:MAG TPA: hypothetical protein VFG37_05695 [Planctomycetota bacterium]|nr:hypothetical protein [Planctomycetota bacterium]
MSQVFRIAAVVVAFALGSTGSHAFARLGAPLDGDGGASGSSDCNQDVKKVDASSTCLRSTWCGGATGGSVTIGAVKFGSAGGGGSVDCCLTEVVIPEHTEIIAGHRRIVRGTDVDGALITRRCSSPLVFLWIEFGSWTCETDSITKFGKFPIDSAQSCD